MQFSFAKCGGIIDWFEHTLSKQELILKTLEANIDKTFNEISSDFSECEEQIKEVIFKQEKEYPHTIRYFSVPNFDQLAFDVYAVAKIDNNGSTYIFGSDERVIDAMSPDGWNTLYI